MAHCRRNCRPDCRARRLRVERLEDRRMLAVATVTTHLDVIDFNDGVTSLREAIFATNTLSGADTILFDGSLDGATINLDLALGELDITDSLTIDASNLSGGMTIDAGNGADGIFGTGDGIRIFNIDDGDLGNVLNVELSGLTLTGGDLGEFLSSGGAIVSRENTILQQSVLSGNAVRGMGGGLRLYVGTTSTLEDVQIQGNSDVWPDHGGGGIWNEGTLSIINSVVNGNTAALGLASGGGIWSNGMLLIERSTISGNTAAEDGGGVVNDHGSLSIVGSTIVGNTATRDDGGGVWSVSQTGEFMVSNSIIVQNNAKRGGGGVFAAHFLPAVIAGTTISGNTAAFGGGVNNRIGMLDIVDSIISGNTGISANFQLGYLGGGVNNYQGDLYLRGSIVSENEANQGAGIGNWGGELIVVDSSIIDNSALWIGGGVANQFGTFSITGSTISNNSAINGGGVHVVNTLPITGSISGDHGSLGNVSEIIGASAADMTIRATTISGNMATGVGGGVFASLDTDESLLIEHSTIALNQADTDSSGSETGGGIFVENYAASLNHAIVAKNTLGNGSRSDVSGSASAAYTLVGDRTGSSIPNGNGNKLGTGPAPIDPLLGPLANNGGPTLTHALLPGSPAINAGDPNFDPSDPDGDPLTDDATPYDQRGPIYARVYGGRIDMGAVEVQPQHADFDSDGDVDGLDFLAWQIGFGTPAPNAVKTDGDADNDLDVDSDDLTAWENAFGASGGAPLVAITEDHLERAVSSSPAASPVEPATASTIDPHLVDLALTADDDIEKAKFLEDEFVQFKLPAQAVTSLGALQGPVSDFGDIAVSRPRDCNATIDATLDEETLATL